MSTAVITGATAGIGLAFARRLARDGVGLVLVARDADRLGALAAELQGTYRIDVEVLPADLATREGTDAVGARLADEARPVAMLINNAGFGLNAGFRDSDVDDEQRLLDVLVTAPMRLTHAAVPGMVARGGGGIINVGSVAAFIAGGTYSAAKAWITVFSESLGRELDGTGVHVTCVAPGFTHTEFHQRATMDMSGMPEFMWLDVDHVVDDALRDVVRGRALSVPGLQYKVLSTAARYLPRPIVRRASGVRPNERNRKKAASGA